MAFTNHWAAPNGKPVVSAVIKFPDGPRSAVGVYRNNWPMPTGPVQKAWTPIHTTGHPHSNADLDKRLAAGDILYYLAGDLGTDSNGVPWASGWWSHTLLGVRSSDIDAFTWGTNKLASQVTGSAQSNGIPTPSAQPVQPGKTLPVPTPAGGALPRPGGGAVIVTPAPVIVAKPRWPYYAGGIAVAAVALWLILE
jgi:hypothetical protein